MKKPITLLTSLILVFALVSCSAAKAAPATELGKVQSSTVTSAAVTGTNTEPIAVVNVSTAHSETHDDPADYIWEDSSVIPIVLNEDSITVNDNGVTVDNQNATITSAGSYSLSGSLAEGQIIVDTEDEEVVRLILNGVELHNSTGAAIYINNAKKVILVLADNTKNNVSDGNSYVFEDPDTDEPNAAIFSKSDLTISGSGSLNVTGNYNDGISSKDGLIIAGGTLRVNSVDDGIRGKDYLVIKNGDITVNALRDGLKSDNTEDSSKGYITIDNGSISITANGDAIHAETDVTITDGEFTLASGGGSDGLMDAETSAKGIKAAVRVMIEGGTFTIDSADDAIHSNDAIIINGGTFNISSGDDGIHADSTLNINDGDILISESYEGLESAVITINNGDIDITSSDDGINVAAGNDGSGTMNPGMAPGGKQRPDSGGKPGDGTGQDNFTYDGDYYLYIHGGYIVVEAAGDGLDVNGAIEMTDGVVIVNGPTEQMNGALDYDGLFNITGGFLVAAGSSGMAQVPGSVSTQHSALVYFNTTQQAGTLVHIQNEAGEEILTFAPAKEYQAIAFSSPELVAGTTYNIYTGGTATGVENDGLTLSGSYTPGTQYQSFTISNIVTTIGSGGNRP